MASPPCQSYTLSNSRRNPSDKRGRLYETMLKFVEATNPDWIMVENVPQMLTVKLDDGIIVGKHIVEILEALGYTVNYGVQNAADFSTPQNRRRAVILASKIGV